MTISSPVGSLVTLTYTPGPATDLYLPFHDGDIRLHCHGGGGGGIPMSVGAGRPGPGGDVRGFISLAAGTFLTFAAGNNGASPSIANPSIGGAGGLCDLPGYDGGRGGGGYWGGGGGGGGGAASAVLANGVLLMVAGGAGGEVADSYGTTVSGGSGGYLSSSWNGYWDPGTGNLGRGGTQTAAGAASPWGAAGSGTNGGDGYNHRSGWPGGGGGGGGGYWGGGGGRGGGGGSTWRDPGFTSVDSPNGSGPGFGPTGAPGYIVLTMDYLGDWVPPTVGPPRAYLGLVAVTR